MKQTKTDASKREIALAEACGASLVALVVTLLILMDAVCDGKTNCASHLNWTAVWFICIVVAAVTFCFTFAAIRHND